MNQAGSVEALLRQAQHLITKDATSAALQFARVLADAEHFRLSPQQRISLGLSLGLAQFASPIATIPLLNRALGNLHDTLAFANTLPVPDAKPAIKGAYDPYKALTLMNRTLAGLAERDCVAFAFGGVLLGLTRDGCLLPFDKDLDVVVPLNYFNRVCQLLTNDGWKRSWVPVQADNFACFLDADTGITLDVFAYAFDRQHIDVIGGWWPRGLDRQQGRVLKFSPFAPELLTQADGRFWRIKHPESVLTELYGAHWRVADPLFDSTLETPALSNWTLYTRVWAALKLLEAWTQGHQPRMQRILTVIQKRDPTDPLAGMFAGVQHKSRSTQQQGELT